MLSSPNEKNFRAWKKHAGAIKTIMNCPDETDVKAMCVWETRNTTEMHRGIGPTSSMRMCILLQYSTCSSFQFNEYEDRVEEIRDILAGIGASNAVHYGMIGGMEECPSNDASHKLMKAVRLVTQRGLEAFVNLPVCFSLGSKLFARLLEVGEENDIIFRLLKYR
ncbi:retrotransposon hot spot (RHS) protein [Trypanosoma rangeli]|uniref:Retrotransposon hot spot (RHS) protein n=1 Tax=Trypanosoma rangeli TaxID=5698 RepID=A0A422MYZ5_TRYRA|nr:retrotransposon hot spot (RHS) protein [Trypanosoma rangeli]RNE98380.1 retrotransposon hot spot (RHS) protein [Trypanosoma rangeli]|eukprot:RNE98380.1 retrotransposon hot spot (RHS) protein [Trypanosoma rangeli]